MHLLFRFSLVAVLGTCSPLLTAHLLAQEPGWTSRVFKLGPEREISEQTPILERPYRPLHFYGNAVRRNYYRGNPLPMPRDILITGAFLAPSSRERDIEREQRFAGYDYRRAATEEAAKENQPDEAGDSAAESALAEEPNAEESRGEQTRADQPASGETDAVRQSSRRSGLDAQVRRNRRGN